MSVPSTNNNSRLYKHKSNVKEPTYWIYKKINRAGIKKKERKYHTERDEMADGPFKNEKKKEEMRVQERACARACGRWRTLRVSETSGAGISTTQVCVAMPHPSTAGRHLHRGIDLRSYDSESTRGPPENSGAGVPGVAGADPFGGVDPGSAIAASCAFPLTLKDNLFFFVFFLLPAVQQK